MTQRLPKLIEGVGCCVGAMVALLRKYKMDTQAEATIRGELTTLTLSLLL